MQEGGLPLRHSYQQQTNAYVSVVVGFQRLVSLLAASRTYIFCVLSCYFWPFLTLRLVYSITSKQFELTVDQVVAVSNCHI